MIAYAVVAFAIVQAIAALRAAPGSPLASRAVVLAAVALLQVALGDCDAARRCSDRACPAPSGAGARSLRPFGRPLARDRHGASGLRRIEPIAVVLRPQRRERSSTPVSGAVNLTLRQVRARASIARAARHNARMATMTKAAPPRMVKIEAIPCTAMPAAATVSSDPAPDGVLRKAP